MKRSTCALMLCAAVLAISLSSTASAAVDISHFRGEGGVIQFDSFDPATCISTSGYIFATESRSQSDPGSPDAVTTASISLFQSNNCTYEALACVSGTVVLPDGAFEIAGHLGSATLNTTIEGYDCLTGNPESVSVAVAWIGEGEVTHGHNQSSYSYPGGRTVYRFNGQTRNAVASGSITYRGTTIALENTYSYLSAGTSGTLYKYD